MKNILVGRPITKVDSELSLRDNTAYSINIHYNTGKNVYVAEIRSEGSNLQSLVRRYSGSTEDSLITSFNNQKSLFNRYTNAITLAKCVWNLRESDTEDSIVLKVLVNEHRTSIAAGNERF